MMAWQDSSETALLSITREAMKGEFEVLFSRTVYPQGTEAALDALDEVERLEQILSVFRFDSRVRLINLTASESPVRLDDDLFDLVSLCLEMSKATEGAVDITSGPLWKIWGFARRDGRVPSEEEIRQSLECVGSRLIELDPDARTIRFRKPGVELNFGCVGKGFALDRAAKKLRDKGVDRFLFHGGLSSVLASGENWTIGAAHPMRPGQRLAEISLDNAAIATSSSEKQFFRHRGHRYSHLIDPRNGLPGEKVLSVSVLAPDATQAELLSTAFFILGPEPAEQYCRNRPDIAALFVLPSTKGSRYEIRHFGFPSDKFQLLDQTVSR